MIKDKQIEIMEAAEKLFAVKGYDATSVREIAKDAEVNVAMISYYFGSKEKLLDYLFAYRMNGFKIDIETLFTKHSKTLDILKEFVFTYVNTMFLNAGLYKILAVEGTIKQRLLQSKPFLDLKKYNLSQIEKVLELGYKEGVFKNQVRGALVYSTIVGTFMNFQMNKSFMKNTLNLEDEEAYKKFVQTELSNHLYITIKALLTYEN